MTIEDVRENYVVSDDYHKLKNLIDSGKEIVGFVVFDFNKRIGKFNEDKPNNKIDVVLIHAFMDEYYKDTHYMVDGIYCPQFDYCQSDPFYDGTTFEEMCQMHQLLYIEPRN